MNSHFNKKDLKPFVKHLNAVRGNLTDELVCRYINSNISALKASKYALMEKYKEKGIKNQFTEALNNDILMVHELELYIIELQKRIKQTNEYLKSLNNFCK
jgi:SOS response regulatory protein OraA/RecX